MIKVKRISKRIESRMHFEILRLVVKVNTYILNDGKHNLIILKYLHTRTLAETKYFSQKFLIHTDRSESATEQYMLRL